jgi:hypothetical protein
MVLVGVGHPGVVALRLLAVGSPGAVRRMGPPASGGQAAAETAVEA